MYTFIYDFTAFYSYNNLLNPNIGWVKSVQSINVKKETFQAEEIRVKICEEVIKNGLTR